MKGLLRNNYYSMQESMKLSAIMVLFLGVVAAFLGNSFLTMAISVPILIFPINIGSSLQTDETSNWNKFEITLPVSRSSIIKCKYLSFLMLVLTGLICSFLIFLLFVILGHDIKISVVAYSYFFGLSMAILTGSLMYPLILKFGASKSELVIIISVIGASAFFTGLWLIMSLMIKSADMRLSAGITATIFSFLCFIISYFVSVRIHSKKEL